MLRCLYVDLDGTLFGAGASLFRDHEDNFTMIGARALEACARADVEVVIYSGRREAQVFEDARLLGLRAYIFEIGSGIVIDGEREWLTGGFEPTADGKTIHDQMTESGAPDLLLEHFAGRLEYHAPWHTNRDVTHLFRGMVDTDEAARLLEENGITNLRLVDNGTLHRRNTPTLPDLDGMRAYHLVAGGASKSRAVARHMQARGYAPEECIAAGDSREDMDAADVVGTFWLMQNAIERDPSIVESIAGRNVRITEGRHGAGVYEAVVTTLAEGHGGG
jgi:hydroxymethylpyrimidine pyrophosphatase-like HAD family hydrolase